MEIKETIGIDVSKSTLDAHIHCCNKSSTFGNSPKGFDDMLEWVFRSSTQSLENILFAFEHTGLYSERLKNHLSDNGVHHTIISGLEIKRSQGMARGKNDSIDAAKIALYAYRLREEIGTSSSPSKSLVKIKKLLTLRERLVKQRAGYKTSLGEQKGVLEHDGNRILFAVQQRMITELSKNIKEVEQEIRHNINLDGELAHIYGLLTSIRCIGEQTALFLMVYTEGFTKFSNSRKFAAYCGVAPYPNQSGTSLKGRSKVSHLANKKIKSLLDLCARSSIIYNSEIKQYYLRRVAQGKSKMGTINIIRNKLIARAFAVVHRGTPYVELYRHAS